MKSFAINDLHKLCGKLLAMHGISQDDIPIIFDHLLEEELLGKSSHGFFRLPSIVEVAKATNAADRMFVVTQFQFHAHIKADNSFGLVAAKKACDVGIAKTIKNGISLVGLTGYIGTTGALGYYSRLFARKNLISIICCSSEYAVAPWGGRDAILGTNPLAISIPDGSDPIIIDFATAAKTYGELMLAVKSHQKIPEGIVLDSNGRPSTDPNDANDGCQLPMAEHKGYALSLAIEILSGFFIGAKSGKNAVLGSDGMFILSFKPDLFIQQKIFNEHMKLLKEEILNSSLAVGFQKIRIPGEGSLRKIDEGRKNGTVDLQDSVFADLNKLFSSL